MANIYEKFTKSVSGFAEKESDFVQEISPSGDFKRITGIEVILNSWNNILLTPRGSHFDDPSRGSDLYKFVFRQRDEFTEDDMKEEIITSLRDQDNRATIENISIYLLTNSKGYQVEISVFYKGEKENLQLIIDENLYLNLLD